MELLFSWQGDLINHQFFYDTHNKLQKRNKIVTFTHLENVIYKVFNRFEFIFLTNSNQPANLESTIVSSHYICFYSEELFCVQADFLTFLNSSVTSFRCLLIVCKTENLSQSYVSGEFSWNSSIQWTDDRENHLILLQLHHESWLDLMFTLNMQTCKLLTLGKQMIPSTVAAGIRV